MYTLQSRLKNMQLFRRRMKTVIHGGKALIYPNCCGSGSVYLPQGRARRQTEIRSRAIMLAARHRMEFRSALRKLFLMKPKNEFYINWHVKSPFHSTWRFAYFFHISIWEVFHKADAHFMRRTWELYELLDFLLQTITNNQQLHLAEVFSWSDNSLCLNKVLYTCEINVATFYFMFMVPCIIIYSMK